jgi:transposase
MSDFTVVERIDSCIIILQNLKELHLAEIINEVIPAHGNWGGLGIGETACIWITHVLCQNDHCMSHVQKWAWERRYTISGFMGFPILESDLSDDRLAIILEKLYDPENWEKIEDKINSSSIRIYGFPPEIIRLDCTTVNSDRVVTEGGLIQFGKSKDDPTRPQVKIALATSDPIGLPLTVSVVPGNCADDPLYLPVYHRVRKSLGYSNLLYVGA